MRQQAWADADLRAKLAAAERREAETHAYLSRLLTSHAPDCEPEADLMTLCSQIDNLMTGLPYPLASPSSPSPDAERAEARDGETT